MKRISIVMVALAMSLSTAAFAQEDGAALYKSKCSGCHGASGEGKIGAKTKPPHTKPIAGLSADQIKAISDFVGGLK